MIPLVFLAYSMAAVGYYAGSGDVTAMGLPTWVGIVSNGIAAAIAAFFAQERMA